MTIHHATAAEAIADATGRHFEAQQNADKYGVQPDPDRPVRDRIEKLREWAPSAPVADSLLAIGWQPVPIDPSGLVAVAGPLASVSAILTYWMANPSHGVGLQAGVQPGGSCLVAVKGPPAALRAWLAEAGTELVTHDNGEGVLTERRTYRPCPNYAEVRWVPPARSPMGMTAFFGREEGHEAADRIMRPREDPLAAPAFLVWQSGLIWAAGDGARRLKFTSKKIARGVEVVGEGCVPWHVQRRDGWSLNATTSPVEGDMPPWLLTALGAKSVAA